MAAELARVENIWKSHLYEPNTSIKLARAFKHIKCAILSDTMKLDIWAFMLVCSWDDVLLPWSISCNSSDSPLLYDRPLWEGHFDIEGSSQWCGFDLTGPMPSHSLQLAGPLWLGERGYDLLDDQHSLWPAQDTATQKWLFFSTFLGLVHF